MATMSAAYASPAQLSPAVHETAAGRGGHDLAPVVGLMVGLGAALLLWALPVATWLLLR